MIDRSHKGKVFAPFSYTVERGKLNEFVQAIRDDNPIYRQADPPMPPTFATVYAFWGGMSMEALLRDIGIEMRSVLHGEQEYEFLAPVHIGDTVTGQARIADIYPKAGMDFVEIITEYTRQDGTAVLNDHALIMVRG